MEKFITARQSKREYLRSIHKRYRQGRRTQKTAMLEEFCKVCGYNRKYAIWLLSRPLSNAVARRVVTQRSATYSKAGIAVLAKVWEISGYLCSQRLKAALPQWLPWIKKHFKVNGKLEKELLAISARQMDRRLRPHKCTVKRRLYGTTRPGSLSTPTCLTSFSKDPKTVASNSPARGPTKKMTMRMWSRKTGPMCANSWGWDRYDSVEALKRINQLYEQLRIFQNLFQPSMKISTKTRKGSRVIRRYDQPATPWQRVLKASAKPGPQIQALKSTLDHTDPFELSRRIDQQLDCLYSLAGQRNGASREKTPLGKLPPNLEPDNRNTRSLPGSAWRNRTFSKKLKRQQYEKQRQIRTQASVRFSHDSTNISFS